MRSSVERMQEQYGDQVDFHILNTDQLSTQDLAVKYQVRGIPLIVLLDTEGQEVRRLLGYQTEDQLIEALEGLLAATAS